MTYFHLRQADPDPLRSRDLARFTVAFGFRVKGSGEPFSGLGECRPSGRGAVCLVEGDGGSFTLAPDGGRLRVTIERLELEGPKTFADDLAKSDNRIILLRPAGAAACAGR